jgi:two-component system cell cycle sensor histidine kinase/response regulator CckA
MPRSWDDKMNMRVEIFPSEKSKTSGIYEYTEENLRESEDRFYQIFHASSHLMAISTVKEGRIIDFNEAFARLAGYKREEFIGKTTMEYGIWADSQQRDKVLRRLQEEGAVHNLELEARAKDGKLHTLLFSINKIALDCEPHLLSTAVDITDLKNAEKELKESEGKYRELVEKSLQGLAIMQDGRFVFCNGRFAEITGYSVEELQSLSPEQIIEMINVEDRGFIDERRRDQAGGKPVPANYEYRGIKKDGTEIWVEVFSSPIEYGGKPAIQAAFMDITERKKAVEDVQKALDWQKAIFEGSKEAIMISDKNSKIIAANERACQLTGYSREELLNMGAWDLNRTVDPSELDSLCSQILNGEEVLGETQIYTKDGRKIDVEFGHRRISISGEFYIHSIARDISNQKRLEKQLQQAQKMEAIGVLAGGVAHDFNNLLNVIIGYSELALRALASDHPVRRDIEQVIKAGQQATSLTSQLLAFSRKQILQPEILNLNDIIDETNRMLRRLIGEDIEIASITKPDLGFVNADPVQLQQIIMNLAVNARDAMPHGGRLTIETANVEFDEDFVRNHADTKVGRYVMLAISDDGIGMDAATQARIFEPFFTTKGIRKGTGLGLSTVYGIVKQSNGYIFVYSELGLGTTFKMYLPRVEGATAPAAAETKSAKEFRGSETVLVVEDEKAVQALICRVLRERGYNVLEAADGIEAQLIDREYEGEIHLVLTDVILPGISGKDIIAQLKSSRPGVKALYISGYTDKTIVNHGVLDSDVAFLQKPFTTDGLARKVRDVIGHNV